MSVQLTDHYTDHYTETYTGTENQFKAHFKAYKERYPQEYYETTAKYIGKVNRASRSSISQWVISRLNKSKHIVDNTIKAYVPEAKEIPDTIQNIIRLSRIFPHNEKFKAILKGAGIELQDKIRPVTNKVEVKERKRWVLVTGNNLGKTYRKGRLYMKVYDDTIRIGHPEKVGDKEMFVSKLIHNRK